MSNTASTPPTIDAVVSADQPNSVTTVTTSAFSTTAGNELLLAFIATDYLGGTNTTITGVSGAGLTWQLVQRTNVQSGTSEIWRAFAAAPLVNVTVTATLSQAGRVGDHRRELLERGYIGHERIRGDRRDGERQQPPWCAYWRRS